ncbi:hypothetical protein J5N97_019638 [Dioscorea zingiberensis]|uniref:Uncharacterized protein n=1 Tax=Dioscorea zingiberensis TaxID=325984 RepID=A0A9D5CEZ6_9LILI|nr:hypothetical protein J5N97_019638 [Dioscorea zingiberensis]
MAWNLAPYPSLSTVTPRFQGLERLPPKIVHGVLSKNTSLDTHQSLPLCKATQSEGATEESSSTGSSARAQLDLLEQLTYTSPDRGDQIDGDDQRPTVREQLSELIGDRDGEFSLPLGKKLKASLNSLTISQKRNIKRQAYLNEVARRNDSTFFATIGAFVILPPVAILSIAILTGYVQLFP